MNKPWSVPALNGRDRFVSGEEGEYEEKHISLSGEKILSWAIDGDVYHIHYGISWRMVNDEVFSAPFALSKTGLSYAVQEWFSLDAFCRSFSSAAASI